MKTSDWVIKESLPHGEAQAIYEEIISPSLGKVEAGGVIVFRKMIPLRRRFLSWLRGGSLKANCTEWRSTGPIEHVEFAETEEGADLVIAGCGRLAITDILI